MLIRNLRFEHPATEQQAFVRPSSYLWAGLFGAGYVMWVGKGSVGRALAINAIAGLAVLAILAATFSLAPLLQVSCVVLIVPVAIYLQGRAMLAIVRRGYRREGWLVYAE